MRLYLLRDRELDKEYAEPHYDEFYGFVIRAHSIGDARWLARKQDGVKWLANSRTSCELLLEEGNEGIIMEDFHAG